jgi:hypothetical protein
MMSREIIKLRKGIEEDASQSAAEEYEYSYMRLIKNPSPIGIWYTINFERCESQFNSLCEITEQLLRFKPFVEQQEVWRQQGDADVQRLLLEEFQFLHQKDVWLELKLNEAVKVTFPDIDIEVADFFKTCLPPLVHDQISEIDALRLIAEGFYRLTGLADGIGKHLDELRERIFSVRPKWRGRNEWRQFYVETAVLPHDLTESVKRFLKLLDAELESQREGGKGKARSAGRPPAWNREVLTKELIRAGQILYRRLYRAPTLKEMAKEMGKRRPITEGALKMAMRRNNISWKEFKTDVFLHGPAPELLQMVQYGDE